MASARLVLRWAVAILLLLLAPIAGECPAACSGHGKCTSYDMCICTRNWQANDCSERVCQFGLAHVDTPMGDLDSSGRISGPAETVVENSAVYPYGTTEQFPQMEDSDLNVLTQSAHFYMECSNKGVCDRKSGTCECFPGYDGVACQRASCPGWPLDTCSGHGRCLSAAQMARADHGNFYGQWDKHSTMGCKCDAGYYGAACHLRRCKLGIDPLYLDDSATIKYSTFDLATLTSAPGFSSYFDRSQYFTPEGILFNDGTAQGGKGYWAIRFFDATGEDWVTGRISAGASCAEVVHALESLPNNVIPPGMTMCSRSYNAAMTPDNTWTTTGGRTTLATCLASMSFTSQSVFSGSADAGTPWALKVASTTSGAVTNGMVISSASIRAAQLISGCSDTATVMAYTGTSAVFSASTQGDFSSLLTIFSTTSGSILNGMTILSQSNSVVLNSCSASVLSGGAGTCSLSASTLVGPAGGGGGAVPITGWISSASTTLTITATSAGAVVDGMTFSSPAVTLSGCSIANGVGTCSMGSSETVALASALTTDIFPFTVCALSSPQAVASAETITGLLPGASMTLNIAATSSGALSVGTYLRGAGIPPGTFVTDMAGLTAGAGTVTLNAPIQVGINGATLLGYSTDKGAEVTASLVSQSSAVYISAVSTGTVAVGMTVTGTGLALGTTIASFGPAVTATLLSMTAPAVNTALLQTSSVGTLKVGQAVTGTGVPLGVTITAVGTSFVRLSNLVTVSAGTSDVIAQAISAGTGGVGMYTLSQAAVGHAYMLPYEASSATAPPRIYDPAHPATSKHPYKITYRMSIWDSYSGSSSYEDIGEGGMYSPLIWAPGSFPKKQPNPAFSTPLAALVHAGATGANGGGVTSVLVEPVGATRYTTATGALAAQGASTITLSSTAGLVANLTVLFGSASLGPIGARVTDIAGNTVTINPALVGTLAGGVMLFGVVQVMGYTSSASSVGSRTIYLGVHNATSHLTGMGIQDSANVYFFASASTSSATMAVVMVSVGSLADGMVVTGCGIVGTVTISGCAVSASIVAGTGGVMSGSPVLLMITAVASGAFLSGMSVTYGGVTTHVYCYDSSTSMPIDTTTTPLPWTCATSTPINIPDGTTLAASGAGLCTMSSIQSLSGTSLCYAAAANLGATAIPRGTIITRVDTVTGAVTLSQSLSASLAGNMMVTISPYASLAPGMVFSTPLSPYPAQPSTITVVSGPSSLGLYTLTLAAARSFAAGDVIRVLQAGENVAETTRQTLSGYIYRLKLLGNPGKLQQPEILTHLDGRRSSLVSVNFAAGDYVAGANLGVGGAAMEGTESKYRVMTKVWTDGQQGEDVDYVADHCDGVQVRIGNYLVSTDGSTVSQNTVEAGVEGNYNAGAKFFLTGLSAAMKAKLMRCLGPSDFDDSNNIGVASWDYGMDHKTGAITYPHLIKLVRSVTAYSDGGYYAALYYSETEQMDKDAFNQPIGGGTFFLLNPFSPPDAFATDRYDVYTTKGTLALTSAAATAVFGFASRTVFTVTAPQPHGSYDGDISCELTLRNGQKFAHFNVAVGKTATGDATHKRTVCLEKTDIVTFLNTRYGSSGLNPPHINLYTVTKLAKTLPEWSNSARYGIQHGSPIDGSAMGYGRNEIHLDLATNWASSVGTAASAPLAAAGITPGIDTLYNSTLPSGFNIYKFYPHKPSGYEYVAECSNRGNCNVDLGVCQCFSGYTGDACHQQTTLAM